MLISVSAIPFDQSTRFIFRQKVRKTTKIETSGI